MLRCRFWIFLFLSLFVSGCGSSETRPRTTRAPQTDAGPEDGGATHPDWLAGTTLGTVPPGTIGPYIAYNQEGALALFARPAEPRRRWFAQALDKLGRANGGVRDVGIAPDEPAFVSLRAGSRGSFFALWPQRAGGAFSLEMLVLSQTGAPRAAPHDLAQTAGPILWADGYAVPKGFVVVWAEDRGGAGALFSLQVDETGKPRNAPRALSTQARAWQLEPMEHQAALATVQITDKNSPLGTVRLFILDAQGRAKTFSDITQKSSAHPDVDLARIKDSIIVAWTDGRNVDNQVFGAVANLRGAVRRSERLLFPPLGEQALFTLLSPRKNGPDRALLVFDEVSPPGRPSRSVRLVTVDSNGRTDKKAAHVTYEPDNRDALAFASTRNGYLSLTSAPLCIKRAPCEGHPSVPWFIRFGSDLSVRDHGPLLADSFKGDAPAMGWGPGCTAKSCLALIAGAVAPSPIASVRLRSRRRSYVLPARVDSPQRPPVLVTHQALQSSAAALSKLAVTRAQKHTYLGWITHVAESPNVPSAVAELGVRVLDEAGQPLTPPVIVSSKALTPGGVALADAGANSKEACMAWVAPERGDPQVFLARLASNGTRVLERKLTSAKGNAADVALTRFDKGWIVAWVDSRDGNGEVYVTKVDALLRRVSPEVRVSNAPGDASSPTILVRGAEVFIAYTDPRENLDTGAANPYLAKFALENLARKGDENLLSASREHARSIRLASAGSDVVAAWFEEPIPGAKAKTSEGLRLIRIDPGSMRTMGSRGGAVAVENAPVTSLDLNCTQAVCRGLISTGREGVLTLESVLWYPNTGRIDRRALAPLNGPPAMDVSAQLLWDHIYFIDQGVSGDRRIRRGQIRWTR